MFVHNSNIKFDNFIVGVVRIVFSKERLVIIDSLVGFAEEVVESVTVDRGRPLRDTLCNAVADASGICLKWLTLALAWKVESAYLVCING